MITCDEIIKETVSKNFNQKKAPCKTQNFYISLAFLLIILSLLIAVRIYYYLTKYRAKQKRLLRFHDTSNNSKQVLY